MLYIMNEIMTLLQCQITNKKVKIKNEILIDVCLDVLLDIN